MADMRDRNRRVIEEFRANGGKVEGPFAGSPLLLLTTTGAKSGLPRTTPVMYLPDAEPLLVFASKAGAPTSPDWYHNLVAHPAVTVEIGAECFEAEAQVVSGAERDRLYGQMAARFTRFKEYQEQTTRLIPVIALRRMSGGASA